MAEDAKHLKSLTNGRVFLYSDNLAARDDMVACTAQGEILRGHTGTANSDGGNLLERKPSKYLGNPANGLMFAYSEALSGRDDFVSIESLDEWESYMERLGSKSNTTAEDLHGTPIDGPEAAVAPPVSLDRAPAGGGAPNTDIVASQAEPGFLPDLTGLGARDAKTVLATWAEANHGVKIDRRPSLEDVIAECAALLEDNTEESSEDSASENDQPGDLE